MTDWQADNETPLGAASDGGTSEGKRTTGQFGDVRADRVELTQGGASTITADKVTLSQGGAGRIRARELSISQGGVGVARTDRLALNENAGAFAVISSQATVGDTAKVFLLVASRTNGPVRTAIDLRMAAVFGAAFAIALALLRR